MLLNKRKLYKRFLLALLLPVVTAANADIIIHGTRVVYPSEGREITVKLSNEGQTPSLVQAWIDEGDAKVTPDKSQVPFVITPPITRVEPGKGQSLRISSLPAVNALSKDRESLYWLNILDIPPKPTAQTGDVNSENFLQLAIRSRIKFFYRPSELKGNSAAAPKKLKWQTQGNNLLIQNPTPFYVTITSIAQKKAGSKAGDIEVISDGLMLSPFSEQSLSVKKPNLKGMTFITINDYGGRVEHAVE